MADQLTPEERKLRDLLWATHPCNGKYNDDGEIQCGRFLPPIDFLRDKPEDIETKILLHNAQLAKQEICPECGGAKIIFLDKKKMKYKVCPKCQGTGNKEACCYCDKKADGAMLVMGDTMAHSDCVIQKLNELLDYDYDGKGKPIKVVDYVSRHRLDRPDREKIAQTPIETHRYKGKRYLTLDGIDQILALISI